MKKPRTDFNYKALYHKIVEKLKEATETLKRCGYESQRFSPKQFFDFLTGETPTGDTITIADVLDNEFLMIHEVVEMSELKKMGVPVNKDTVLTSLPLVYEAHFVAASVNWTMPGQERILNG